jgi:hypothetical protein
VTSKSVYEYYKKRIVVQNRNIISLSVFIKLFQIAKVYEIENAKINYYSPSENYPYQLLLDGETVFPPDGVESGPNVYQFETFRRIKDESTQSPKEHADIGGIIRGIKPEAIYKSTSKYRTVDLEDELGQQITLFFWDGSYPVIDTW